MTKRDANFAILNQYVTIGALGALANNEGCVGSVNNKLMSDFYCIEADLSFTILPGADGALEQPVFYGITDHFPTTAEIDDIIESNQPNSKKEPVVWEGYWLQQVGIMDKFTPITAFHRRYPIRRTFQSLSDEAVECGLAPWFYNNGVAALHANTVARFNCRMYGKWLQ